MISGLPTLSRRRFTSILGIHVCRPIRLLRDTSRAVSSVVVGFAPASPLINSICRNARRRGRSHHRSRRPRIGGAGNCVVCRDGCPRFASVENAGSSQIVVQRDTTCASRRARFSGSPRTHSHARRSPRIHASATVRRPGSPSVTHSRRPHRKIPSHRFRAHHPTRQGLIRGLEATARVAEFCRSGASHRAQLGWINATKICQLSLP